MIIGEVAFQHNVYYDTVTWSHQLFIDCSESTYVGVSGSQGSGRTPFLALPQFLDNLIALVRYFEKT
jgi:hypothetical protein